MSAESILKRLAEHRRYPDRGEEVWREVIEPDLRKTALARASRVKREDGSESKLVPALLRARSVDKQWRWRPQQPVGGELQMSAWARKATDSVFTVTPSDRARWLRRTSAYLKRRR